MTGKQKIDALKIKAYDKLCDLQNSVNTTKRLQQDLADIEIAIGKLEQKNARAS